MSNHFGSIDDVILMDYNENYPLLFEAERDLLLQLLPDDLVRIDHVGSTAIPGIKSKPIIDMQSGLVEYPLSSLKLEILASNGYVYRRDKADANHQFFFKGLPRTHHLHLYPANYAKLKEHILFRDYLINHPETAWAYQQLKISLAARFYDNREAYTDSKTEFIQGVLRKCK